MNTKKSALQTPSSWPKAIIDTLKEKGIEYAPALEELGINPILLEDHEALLPQDSVTRLWNLAVDLSGDDSLGVSAGLKVHAHTYPTVGYSLMSCENLKSSCERLFRYQRILAQGFQFDIEQHNTEYCLTFAIKPDQLDGSIYAVDGAISSFINFIYWLTQNTVSPLRATLCRDKPDNVQAFDRIFKCPIQYNAKTNALYFSEKTMAYDLPTAHQGFSKIHDDKANQILKQLESGSTSEQIRGLLTSLLPSGEPKQDLLATTLHISPSTLKRRLHAENTSYKQLLDRTREELALNYLRDPNLSLTEITYLLGFSENSAFNRAFKRWQATTPMRWRLDYDKPHT